MADNFVGWGPSNHDGGLVRVFQSDHAIHMLSFRVFQLPDLMIPRYVAQLLEQGPSSLVLGPTTVRMWVDDEPRCVYPANFCGAHHG